MCGVSGEANREQRQWRRKVQELEHGKVPACFDVMRSQEHRCHNPNYLVGLGFFAHDRTTKDHHSCRSPSR